MIMSVIILNIYNPLNPQPGKSSPLTLILKSNFSVPKEKAITSSKAATSKEIACLPQHPALIYFITSNS